VKARWSILLALSMMLVSCALQPTMPEPTPESNLVYRDAFYDMNVLRFVDREAGVVCWVIRGSQKGGISCLPLEQTRLEEADW
jgi:hypothetical protein